MTKLLVAACLITFVLSLPERALSDTITTLTFDELSMTAIPAAGLHIDGVTITFAEDSQIPPSQYQGAIYGAPFTAPSAKLKGNVLLGVDPGVFTLTFDQPTTLLSFDAASGVTTSNTFQVRLFDETGASGGTSTIVTNPAACTTALCENPSEGSYSYTGVGIKTAALDFSSFVPGITPAEFAIDNLSFERAATVTTPEPGGAMLLLVGSGLLAAMGRMRRRRTSGEVNPL